MTASGKTPKRSSTSGGASAIRCPRVLKAGHATKCGAVVSTHTHTHTHTHMYHLLFCTFQLPLVFMTPFTVQVST